MLRPTARTEAARTSTYTGLEVATMLTTTKAKSPQFFAGQKDCPTLDKLRVDFFCDHEMACELLDLAESGFFYGTRGHWPDQSFAEDNDWVYGIGEHILMLEFRLDQNDDAVFQVFRQAHQAGLDWFARNSN